MSRRCMDGGLIGGGCKEAAVPVLEICLNMLNISEWHVLMHYEVLFLKFTCLSLHAAGPKTHIVSIMKDVRIDTRSRDMTTSPWIGF